MKFTLLIIQDIISIVVWSSITIPVALSFGFVVWVFRSAFSTAKNIDEEFKNINMKQEGKLIKMNVDPAEGIESEDEMQDKQEAAKRSHFAGGGFL